MLGFELDIWDYITFLVLLVFAVILLGAVVWIAGLPGRIAIARKHPDAEAVGLMGWAGFLPVVPWIQAFIWAFKPTDKVDIRRFPREEARALEEDLARLTGKPQVPPVPTIKVELVPPPAPPAAPNAPESGKGPTP